MRHGEDAIDIVYRRLVIHDVIARPDDATELVKAMRAQAACFVNPFVADLLGHKSVFDLLAAGAHDLGLTGAESNAIRNHIPWTRRLAAADVRTDSSTIGLDAALAEDRTGLVLKPAHDYGGHGVHLGWETEDDAWRALLERFAGEDWILQRRVPAHREQYPLDEPGFPLRTLLRRHRPVHVPSPDGRGAHPAERRRRHQRDAGREPVAGIRGRAAMSGNVEVVRDLLDALDAGDFQRVRELVAPEFETVPVSTGVPMGLEEWLRAHAEVHDAFPSLRRNPSDFSQDGDLVRVWLHITALHDRPVRLPALGIEEIPPTGLLLRPTPHEDTFVVRDGKVVSVHSDIPAGGGLRGMLDQIRTKEPPA